MDRWKGIENDKFKDLKYAAGNIDNASVLFVDYIEITKSHLLRFSRDAEMKNYWANNTLKMDCRDVSTTYGDPGNCSLLCPFISVGLQDDGLCLVLTCRANPRIIVSKTYADERERLPTKTDNVRRIEPIQYGERSNDIA